MLFHLICTATALLASGKKDDPFDLGALTSHADSLDEQKADPLAAEAKAHPFDFLAAERAHQDLHDAITGVHRHVHDLLEVPEVPHGEDHDARLKAIMEAFKAHAPKKDNAPADPAAAVDPADPADPAAGEAADPEAPADPVEAAPAEPTDEAPKEDEEQKVAKAAAVKAEETEALAKIGKSLKTMTVLHVLMKPMMQKLQVAAEHMPAGAKEHAEKTMHHMMALDMYSEKAVEMLNIIQQAQNDTPEKKAQAIQMLTMGLIMIKAGIQKHMQELKSDMHVGMDGAIIAKATKGTGVAGKLQMVVAKMEAKVRNELNDPKRQHDPLVHLDVEMLHAMKTAVAKSEALVVVAAKEMQKHPEQSDQFKTALKSSLHEVTDELKTEMDALKKKAMLIAVITKVMKKKQAEEAAKKAEEAPAPPPPADEEEAPAPPSHAMEDSLEGLDNKGIGHAPAQHAPQKPDEDADDTPPEEQEPVQHKAETAEDKDGDLPEPHADDESMEPDAAKKEDDKEPEMPIDPMEPVDPMAPKAPAEGGEDKEPAGAEGVPEDGDDEPKDGEAPEPPMDLGPKGDEPKGMDEPKGLSELEAIIKRDAQLRKAK
jgi:hypothetical protein